VSYVPEDFVGEEPSWVEDEKANFDMVLDKNSDGKLDEQEVKDWFVPDTESTNQVEMRHLFISADSNRVSGRWVALARILLLTVQWLYSRVSVCLLLLFFIKRKLLN